MKNFSLLLLLLASLGTAFAQQSTKPISPAYIVHNRSIQQLTENGREILRFSEAQGAGLAWVKDLEFSEGIIEFDAKGRDVLQKSFLGIAFHGTDNETYETVYFRPFNFLSSDSVRRIHAVQYSFEPRFGFQQLRNTEKDKYESAIRPAGTKPTEWFHVKVEVREKKIRVFVNGERQPCMEVTTLNPGGTGKKIGFWVGNSSNGDFANLKISK